MDPQPLPVKSYRAVGTSRNEGSDDAKGTNFAFLINRQIQVPGTKSSVKIQQLLHGLDARLDFTAEIDWREIGSPDDGIPGLRIDFHETGGFPKWTFESPFGSVVRQESHEQVLDKVHREVPSLRYAHGGRLTVLQDCKYGHNIQFPGVLGLRILRSSFDPDHAPEVAKSMFRYSIVFHQTEPTRAELTRLGAAWNHPLIVVAATLQEGVLPLSKSFAETKTEGVVLTSLKQAEDGRGLILRLVEYNGTDTIAKVELAPELLRGVAKAEVCDLMERPIGTATLSKNGFEVMVKANSFVTVKLSLN
jgi:alpha-mannosidase